MYIYIYIYICISRNVPGRAPDRARGPNTLPAGVPRRTLGRAALAHPGSFPIATKDNNCMQ